MPRLGLATLNHSPLHGVTTQMSLHLDAAAAAGFDALAPDIFWLRALETEGIELETLAEAMAERGLACMEIAGLAIASEAQTAAELDENLRYARVLGAEFVNTRIVAAPDAAVVARLLRCADALAAVGTCIAIEFSNGTQLKDLAQTERFLESLRAHGGSTAETVGLTLDTWHFCQASNGPDWDALESLPVERIANVQLSDGVAFEGRSYAEETMHQRRLPGDGEFDLERIAGCLKEKGFDGAIVVEVLSAGLRTLPIDEFASQTGRSARAWGRTLD